MSVGAIIPAFNEASNIQAVILELGKLQNPPDVIVIDDGSLDQTAELARSAGACVVRLPFNSGIGAAVQTGLRLALDRGYESIVRIDGDAQHDARDLPRLLERLKNEQADFVLGSRYLEKQGFQATILHRLGIRWFCLLLRLVSGLRVTDPTSGFWAANRRAAELLLADYSSDYPEVDSLVHLSQSGCTVEEVAVAMRPRVAGRSSIKGARMLYYMIKVTIALLVGRLRPGRSRES